MTVYNVKIRDRDTGKFLNKQGDFTRVGRGFNSLAYAKTSVAGKLDLKYILTNAKHISVYSLEKDLKMYLNCDFILYTDEGEKLESVKDYVFGYLQKNNAAAIQYVQGFCK